MVGWICTRYTSSISLFILYHPIVSFSLLLQYNNILLFFLSLSLVVSPFPLFPFHSLLLSLIIIIIATTNILRGLFYMVKSWIYFYRYPVLERFSPLPIYLSSVIRLHWIWYKLCFPLLKGVIHINLTRLLHTWVLRLHCHCSSSSVLSYWVKGRMCENRIKYQKGENKNVPENQFEIKALSIFFPRFFSSRFLSFNGNMIISNNTLTSNPLPNVCLYNEQRIPTSTMMMMILPRK